MKKQFKKSLPCLFLRQAFTFITIVFCVAATSTNAQNVTANSNAQSAAESENARTCSPFRRCPLFYTCVDGRCKPISTGCNCRVRPVPPGCAPLCSFLTAKNETDSEPLIANVSFNPISQSTTISFSLQLAEKVTLKIFDPSGVCLKTLADEVFEEGEHSIEWNTAEINAGVYILQIQSATFSQMEKIIVTKSIGSR